MKLRECYVFRWVVGIRERGRFTLWPQGWFGDFPTVDDAVNYARQNAPEQAVAVQVRRFHGSLVL